VTERVKRGYALGAAFNERRNTSRVWPVPPDALPSALRVLAHFRETQPALYAWIAEGAPRLTETEHVARFGEPYRPPSVRKAAVAARGAGS
jgi:hypothetical protein